MSESGNPKDHVSRPDRKSVSLLVKLKHESVQSFSEQFATNLGPGGMFIRSRNPQPVGTPVVFEVQIAGGLRVMRGQATVRWCRQPGDPSGPPGMGLQFGTLDEPTQALIQRMLQHRGPSSAYDPPAAAASVPVAAVPAPLGGSPVSRSGSMPSVAPAIAPLAPLPAGGPPVVVVPPPPKEAVDISHQELLSVAGQGAPPSPSLFEGPIDDFEIHLSPPPPGFGIVPMPVEVKAPMTLPPPAPPAARVPPKEAAPVQPKEAESTAGVFLVAPTQLPTEGPMIGIDLGTSNSCVAVFQNGRATVLRSKDGYNTLPSVVSLSPNGKPMVGHRAKSQMVLNPGQTIYGAKRLVGRMFDSLTVQEVKERFHYSICADRHGRAAVQLGPHVLSLEEVQGLVLKECRDIAEHHLGTKVGRAVVTVPAYYSEPQREAVRKAGALAGLRIERILNEPTAAALAYGLNRELKRHVLVYDLGGGTFDATVLRIDQNVFEVLATGGDTFLGGVDFDNQIVDLLLKKFTEVEGIPFEADSIALTRVSEAAERVKVALSERRTFELHVPMLMVDAGGRPRDLKCTVTRDELESVCAPLVNRTLDVVRDVLLDARLKATEVEEIILVGGQTRMPVVREKLVAMFGKPPHAGVNADEAVALGASLYCASLNKVSSVVLIDVLPMTIGIGLPGGGIRRLIERNVPLPAHASFAIGTSEDNQHALELSLFQGEQDSVASSEYLGTIRIDGLPSGPKGTVRVAVTLRMDAECVLHVEAHDLATKGPVGATIATRYSPEELRKQLKMSATAPVSTQQAVRSQELKERGGRFWALVKKLVGKR